MYNKNEKVKETINSDYQEIKTKEKDYFLYDQFLRLEQLQIHYQDKDNLFGEETVSVKTRKLLLMGMVLTELHKHKEIKNRLTNKLLLLSDNNKEILENPLDFLIVSENKSAIVEKCLYVIGKMISYFHVSSKEAIILLDHLIPLVCIDMRDIKDNYDKCYDDQEMKEKVEELKNYYFEEASFEELMTFIDHIENDDVTDDTLYLLDYYFNNIAADPYISYLNTGEEFYSFVDLLISKELLRADLETIMFYCLPKYFFDVLYNIIKD